MRIEQLMTKSPKTCRPDDSLRQAVGLMWDNDCGCLPVTAGDGSGRLIGMITDRDICVAARFAEQTMNEIRVADAMTKTAWACNPGDDLAEAEAIMGELGVRRLPVIDESERIIGLLSLADLAREAAREHESMECEGSAVEVALLLATICEPHQVANHKRRS